MKRHPLIPIALTLALAAACTPNPQQPIMGTNIPTTTPQAASPASRNTSQRYPVQFKVETPANFRTQQVAPTFARLQIEGAESDVEIINGDANGFIPITGDTTMVEANVPAGENITVSLSTHLDNAVESPAAAVVGGVFHLNDQGQLYDAVPIPNTNPPEYQQNILANQQVELSVPGQLVALLVQELRLAAGTAEDPLAPIDFETYKSFASALLQKHPLAIPETLGGVNIKELADLITRKALVIDQDNIANHIQSLSQDNQIRIIKNPEANPNFQTPEYIRPEQILISAPVSITHSYPSDVDVNDGIIPSQRVLPMDLTQVIGNAVLTAETGAADIVSFDERNSNHYLYAFKPATENAYGNTLLEYFKPRDNAHPFFKLEPTALVAGEFNGGAPSYTAGDKTALVYTTEYRAANPGELWVKGVDYTRLNAGAPNIYWQKKLTAAGAMSGVVGSQYTPTLWHSKWNNTGCSCDDRDILYIVHDTRIFAVTQGNSTTPSAANEGVVLWSRDIAISGSVNRTTRAGTLSQDGKTLYLLTTDIPSRLVAIHVDPLEGVSGSVPVEGYGHNPAGVNYGQVKWQVTLPNLVTSPSNSVATGSNGVLYVVGNDQTTMNKGLLFAVNDNGTSGSVVTNFPKQTHGSLSFTPVIDRPPGASEDILYVSDGSTLQSYTASGTERFSFPIRGSSYPLTSTPLLAEETDGTRVMYISRGNGLITALRLPNVAPIAPQQLWSRVPGGVIQSNLLLQNGYLYASTRTGGEGQIVRFFALKVHTPKIAQTAPWPVRFGRQTATGVSHLVRRDP